ncbi:hypothetical protein [Terricaulis silvestris]|uniref:Uncharacterized protein n=1 Tax=Terricaulis silvestris TaxID=2686094 RepID=A0A6I6MQC2_9CAUL|nr:hypothetical protein [Terricaulis silvestris]QGZ93363.1 hypothetical protein DSM104635_00173 [Terricaulis silvestris]
MSEDAPATKESWKKLPLPAEREHFKLSLLFTDADGDQMRRGFIPESMDDKWFIFFENGWLYFHRSWTGACIFGARLDVSPAGVRVVDVWASRDKSQYNSAGIESDKGLVEHLIRSLLSA